MKYSNQINIFLAIAGFVVVGWVFSQTYFQPPREIDLGIAELSETDLSPQAPAAYESEASTSTGSVSYESPSRRAPVPNVGLGTIGTDRGDPAQTGNSFTGRGTEKESPAGSVSRTINSSRSTTSSSVPDSTTNTGQFSSPPNRQSGDPEDRRELPLPPAGQAQGNDQIKRTPADSTSGSRAVPFRSSMANRPN